MKRRTLLARLGAVAGIGGIAGCTGSPGGPGGDGTPTSTPDEDTPPPGGNTPTPTDDTPTPTPSATPTAEFEVTERTCGSGEDRAAVSFGGEGVTVEGTIGGSDACATATLKRTALEDGRLTVVVATSRDPDGTPACAQCITDVDYTATIRVPGGGPGTVVVVHEGFRGRRTVTRAERP